MSTFEFIPAWILQDPAESIHLWHIAELTALAGILLAGVMLGLVRRPEEKPLLAQFVGAALLGAAGWLGGELTLRLGIGVDEGANLNAPSSLSGLPAGQVVTDASRASEQSVVG